MADVHRFSSNDAFHIVFHHVQLEKPREYAKKWLT